MTCKYYEQNLCTSCEWIDKAYVEQVKAKQASLEKWLTPFEVQTYLPAVTTQETGFRNKAKMVALGYAHEPKLGIVNHENIEVRLTKCPLYTPSMQTLLTALEAWIKVAGLPPYKIQKQKGELKYILVTQSQYNDTFMVRFVLASDKRIKDIETHLPALLTAFPSIEVVSVNIQPKHMAILEGEQEIFLTQKQYLEENFNGVPLSILPKSFFQTNAKVASALYQTAKKLSEAIQPNSIWDLFCGVGGFGLHCAKKETKLTGIEIEPNAIESAKRSAKKMGLKNIHFQALDTNHFEVYKDEVPDLLIVNPPRRGLGETLSKQLNTFSPKQLFYSSCNAKTLADDLKAFTNYTIKSVQLFDMFAHSLHYEVFVHLQKN